MMKIFVALALFVLMTLSLAAAPALVRTVTPDAGKKLLGAVRYPSFNLTLQVAFSGQGDFSTNAVPPAVRMRRLAAVVSGGSASPQELVEYAGYLQEAGNSRQARTIRLRALREYGQLEKTARNKAAVYAELGGLWTLLGDTQRSVSYYLKAIGLSPSESSLWSKLAFAYGLLGDWARAGKTIKQAIKLAEKDPEIYLDYQFLLRMRFLSIPAEYLRKLFLENRMEQFYNFKAIRYAQSLRPGDFRLQFFRSFFHTEYLFYRIMTVSGFKNIGKGNISLSAAEKAILEVNTAFYRKALAEKRLPAGKLLRTLALNYLCLGQSTVAEAVLRDAVRRQPKNRELRDALYAILQMKGDYPGFVRAVESALAHVHDVRDLLIMGKIRYRSGAFDAALLLIQKALRQSPGHARVLLAMAAVRVRQGKLDRALVRLRAIDRNTPEYPEAQLQIARICLAGNDGAGAYAALDELLKKYPDNKEGRALAEDWFGLK